MWDSWKQFWKHIFDVIAPLVHHLVSGTALISITYWLMWITVHLVPDGELKQDLLAEAGMVAKTAFCLLGIYTIAWLALALLKPLLLKVLEVLDAVINYWRSGGRQS